VTEVQTKQILTVSAFIGVPNTFSRRNTTLRSQRK